MNQITSSQFMLDPNIVFLNHGSFGACPRPVFEAYRRWQCELERQPVEFLGRRFDELLANARKSLATFLNCAADDLVYVPNATTGLNIVARSLKLAAGDEILTTDHEYGALDRTWTFLAEQWGAHYKRQPIPLPVTTHADFVERFWAGVTPQTRIIFLSHITSPTALVLPAQEICRRARAAGILTIIDGAHTAGQIPLDLTAVGADFYSSNCHKWMMSPKGSAFLYARQDVQPLVEPLVVSWGWRPEEVTASPFIQIQEWQGTRDIAAFLAVPAAIEFLEQNNWKEVRAQCYATIEYAREVVSSITGIEPISPLFADANGARWNAQMIALPLPPCDGKLLKRRLYDEYRIEVPITSFHDVQGNNRQLIRISIQGYNARGDVDALAVALGELLPQVTVA